MMVCFSCERCIQACIKHELNATFLNGINPIGLEFGN